MMRTHVGAPSSTCGFRPTRGMELGSCRETKSSAEELQRAAIVAEARSYIGTPYLACADIKCAGIDCGMILVRVMVDTGMVEPFDPRPYPADWHMHRSDERYLAIVTDRTREVESPRPGDVAVF